jgi:hypothetical protein
MFSRLAFFALFFWAIAGLAQNDFEKEVLGACKTEVKDNCKNSKTGRASVQCLRQKSVDKKIKFTDDCRNKIAEKKELSSHQ